MNKIILASASPRRKEIFELLGLSFDVIPSDAEPDTPEDADPIISSSLSAKAKALDISNRYPNNIVVGADTVVSINNIVLGKPKSKDDAFRMLKLLQGKKHQVITAVCLIDKNKNLFSFEEISDVYFRPMSDQDIINYIDTGEPMDKAGAYAVQGIGLRNIEKINGDFYNIMGFPASEFWKRFKKIISED